MSQLSEILLAQKSLEDSVGRKMDELQAQLQTAGSAKDTVAKVADEFRTFRDLTFSMLQLLRCQINECTKAMDTLETRQRRKTLIFYGVPEQENESSKAVVLSIIHASLGLRDVQECTIKTCHRLGNNSKERHRPLLVKFTAYDIKAMVWRAKTKLKGSPASIKEFLTKVRQSVFTKTRLHFGVRCCWTQDGVINVKAPDGSRHKVISSEDLNSLLKKYPKVTSA